LSLELALAGCTINGALNPGLRPEHQFGSVVHSIEEIVPPELEPAHIYEIDGQSVRHERRTFTLTPGQHAIRVWPQGPAQRAVPDLVEIDQKNIQVEPINIEVEAGYRYVLAARTKRTRTRVDVVTEEGIDTQFGDWQVTVKPVVVRTVPPADLETLIKGGFGFFGSLAAGPLLGPVIVEGG
jgi:hypothetical protein